MATSAATVSAVPNFLVVPEPLLVLNPRLDHRFHAFAQGSHIEGQGPAELQPAIRTRYPLATVLARAAAGGQLPDGTATVPERESARQCGRSPPHCRRVAV